MGVLKRKPSVFHKKTVEEDDVEDVMGEESESEPESESESELESEEEGDVKLAEPSKTSIYNREGLLEQLREISWPENVEWIHKLTIDIDRDQEVDVNDDLARELSFYNQALEGTRQAFEKLQSMNLPFLRPSDYYAEMVKTDAHMVKVKGRLLVEKKRIEESEERRKAREAKKIAKEVQAQKLKERAKQKKEDFESVKKWRKQRQQSGFAGGDGDDDMSLAFEEGKGFERSKGKRPGVAPGDRSGGMARKGSFKGKKGSEKKRNNRDHRDSKFGFGGKKGMKKQNTADTTDDLRGFNKGDFSGNKKRKRF
ncbi:Eukaryotic rRNA processing [Macleaya cordata]|uniref:Eukaryotic rRNA processing n=1 Tax=Macleaya cordata TaxID=56857 RepID=A0A200QB55_MACCD|nr:Eukaryotic rRNA processing [Macleaya cordata]